MRPTEKYKQLLASRAVIVKLETEVKNNEELITVANKGREALLADPGAVSDRKVAKWGKLRDKAEFSPSKIAQLKVQMAEAATGVGKLANELHQETVLAIEKIQGERREKFYDAIAPFFTNKRKNKWFFDDPHFGANVAKAKIWFAMTDSYLTLENEKMKIAAAHPQHSVLSPCERADLLLREIPGLSEK